MTKILYVYDPMCGWCYGASSLIKELNDMPNVTVDYMPGGMIERQPIDPSFRNHILQADARIAQMTGAPFGEGYKQRLTNSGPFVLDSNITIQAIEAASTLDIDTYDMLSAIQTAHYRDGKTVEDAAVLKALAIELGASESNWDDAMNQAKNASEKRIAETRNYMQQYGLGGFPTFLIQDESGVKRLDHSQYYGRPNDWKAYVESNA